MILIIQKLAKYLSVLKEVWKDGLKENEQISMEELYKIIKKKYKDFDITSQHLGQVIRDNNKTG